MITCGSTPVGTMWVWLPVDPLFGTLLSMITCETTCRNTVKYDHLWIHICRNTMEYDYLWIHTCRNTVSMITCGSTHTCRNTVEYDYLSIHLQEHCEYDYLWIHLQEHCEYDNLWIHTFRNTVEYDYLWFHLREHLPALDHLCRSQSRQSVYKLIL